MKILIFSDIHNDWKALDRLMETEADYYFAAGDLVSWTKGLDAGGAILARKAERVFVLPGNHESEEDIKSMCKRYGLNAFHGRSMEAGGYHIAGLGYSNRTPFKTPGEYSEPELAAKLGAFRGKSPLVLICHCPPQGTALDRAGAGQHFGSSAVLEFIHREQPAYFFCGHIHEAEGQRETMGRTVGINVGKRGYLLELD